MENVHASTGVEKTKQATNFDELLMIKYPHLTNIVSFLCTVSVVLRLIV